MLGGLPWGKPFFSRLIPVAELGAGGPRCVIRDHFIREFGWDLALICLLDLRMSGGAVPVGCGMARLNW